MKKKDTNQSENDRSTVLAKLGKRAAEDAAFRKKLLVDPHAALREIGETSVPPGLRVKFVEKAADVDIMIVLPDAIREDGELSEEDITAVAGGTNWGCQDVSTA